MQLEECELGITEPRTDDLESDEHSKEGVSFICSPNDLEHFGLFDSLEKTVSESGKSFYFVHGDAKKGDNPWRIVRFATDVVIPDSKLVIAHLGRIDEYFTRMLESTINQTPFVLMYNGRRNPLSQRNQNFFRRIQYYRAEIAYSTSGDAVSKFRSVLKGLGAFD